MSSRTLAYETRVESCVASAFRIPTDGPESDGTLRWNSTTLVCVHVTAGTTTGFGYTYAHQSAVVLINPLLAEIVVDADPRGKMNSGKVVDPFRIDANLHLGRDYQPRTVATHFQFPDDHGNFAYAAQHGVEVGNCRKMEGGTICPSYLVTRKEKHSTRRRARLLFEMLNGDRISGSRKNPWKSKEVHEALSLCLACKACKAEYPVNVDMATYKAKYFFHYYKGRLRQRSATAWG